MTDEEINLDEQNSANSTNSQRIIGNDNIVGDDNIVVRNLNQYNIVLGEPRFAQAGTRAILLYLNKIINDRNELPLNLILSKALDYGAVPLPEVFTDLSVLEKKEGRQPSVKTVQKYPHLVVVGDPGSGKTTLISYLSVSMAAILLGRTEHEQGLYEKWGKKHIYFPVYIPLKDFPRSAKREFWESPEGRYSDLSNYIINQIVGDHTHAEPEIREFVTNNLLSEGGGLIMLDGLDELPHEDRDNRVKVRIRLKNILNDFRKQYPSSRIVVTSRSYAYQSSDDWHLDNYNTAELQPFTPDQIRDFVRHWYQQVSKRAYEQNDRTRQYSDEEISDTVTKFWEQLQDREYMLALAKIPILLTFITSNFEENNQSIRSSSRASLYDNIVKMLVFRWSKSKVDTTRGTLLDDLLLTHEEHLESILAGVAFEAQVRMEISAAAKPTKSPPAIIDEELLKSVWKKVRSLYFQEDVSPDQVDWTTLKERTGILSPYRTNESTGLELYSFIHHSFQEWMAAVAIRSKSKTLLPLDSYWPEDTLPTHGLTLQDLVPGLISKASERWQEVIVFILEATAQNKEFDVLEETLLRLVEWGSSEDPNNPYWIGSVVAARYILEAQRAQLITIDPKVKQATKKRLLYALYLSAMKPHYRRKVGEYICEFEGGDDRVMEDPFNKESIVWHPELCGQLENIWVDILPTYIKIGSPPHDTEARHHPDETRPKDSEREVKPFLMTRYHVTNWLFSQFLESGDYGDEAFWNWSEGSWEFYSTKRRSTNPYEGLLPNGPCTEIAWYEALAFCKWMTARNPFNLTIYLVSEQEWIAAANGQEDRVWIWGDDSKPSDNPDPANTADRLRWRGPCSVGLFRPNRLGIYDMCGNIAEWTQTIWSEDLAKTENNNPIPNKHRTYRGSHYHDADDRMGIRRHEHPFQRRPWLGFRLAAKFIEEGNNS